MKHVKRVGIVINAKAILVALLAVTSMMVCRHFGLSADFPLTLIATAVVFPIVFSINSAYKRREAALAAYGGVKAHGRAIYFAARDWLADDDPETVDRISRLLGGLLSDCRTLFSTPVDAMQAEEDAVYRRFSDLSLFIKSLREKGLAAGEVSRCNQYLSKMFLSFESLKHIYQYRTPVTLRSYSEIFIFILPILYGPYFVEISQGYAQGLEYLMPILFALILVGLENIQNHLENPFDQVGEDDVIINAEKFVERLASHPTDSPQAETQPIGDLQTQ